MKKIIALSLAALFLASVSGPVLAQGTSASSPAKLTAKHSVKRHKRPHKVGKKLPAPKTAPALQAPAPAK